MDTKRMGNISMDGMGASADRPRQTTLRRRANGAVAAATALAVGLTGLGLQPAAAQPGIARAGTSTDFSSAQRRYRRGGNNGAALGAILAIAGTAAVIAASRHRDRNYYNGAPYGYGYQPYGYGYQPSPYYGGGYPRYNGGPRNWHHHW